MPITPIEIATMAPKSQEVSIYKHHESQKPVNEQIQINHQFNNEIKHNQSQTVKTVKSENKEYRYDAKEKGNNSFKGSGQNKKKKENEKGTKLINPYQSGSIDIKI
ncbi:MAG: hypothetical protein K0S41_3234 [Anaerocolumna sp.]|jgi:hypothetical protein|nr:hypothetical protein [Anaerocolumna sp.]